MYYILRFGLQTNTPFVNVASSLHEFVPFLLLVLSLQTTPDRRCLMKVPQSGISVGVTVLDFFRTPRISFTVADTEQPWILYKYKRGLFFPFNFLLRYKMHTEKAING